MFKDYQCFQCAYTTDVQKHLVRHLWTVHLIDSNTYLCPLCYYYFTESLIKLRNHLKVIHRAPRANKYVLASINKFLTAVN
jgi:hypothetical protein